MKFIGIDVGVSKYFVIHYDSRNRNIKKEQVCLRTDIEKLVANKNCIIAIDAPSNVRRYRDKRRSCEEELGIGGYFATPYRKKEAKPWMRSGFCLWDYLQEIGFERIKYNEDNNKKKAIAGHILEVHPTVTFKRLYNKKELNPKLWISRSDPASKRKSRGKEQRKRGLKILYPGQEKLIDDELGIDHIDALIAAYTAEQAAKGNAKAFGDPDEGQIWFPVS